MDEFLKAYNQIQWPQPQTIEYRVYYDANDGSILEYTNESHPGCYILVDRETFACHRFDVKVRDGKLVSPGPVIGKLKPNQEGTPCDPRDITIISAQQPATYWKVNTYES